MTTGPSREIMPIVIDGQGVQVRRTPFDNFRPGAVEPRGSSRSTWPLAYSVAVGGLKAASCHGTRQVLQLSDNLR